LRAPFVYGLINQQIILKDALSSYLHECTRISTNFWTQIHTVFAQLGVLDELCFLSELSRRLRHRPPNPVKHGLLFISRAKDADYAEDAEF
jgi:hypothetical protein